MASDYKFAPLWDNEAGLTAVSFPIYCLEGIQYPEYISADDGTVFPKGAPFCVLVMDALEDAQFAELFSTTGMNISASIASAKITVSLPSIDRTASYDNYNAIMTFRKGLDGQYDGRYWKNVRVRLSALEAL